MSCLPRDRWYGNKVTLPALFCKVAVADAAFRPVVRLSGGTCTLLVWCGAPVKVGWIEWAAYFNDVPWDYVFYDFRSTSQFCLPKPWQVTTLSRFSVFAHSPKSCLLQLIIFWVYNLILSSSRNKMVGTGIALPHRCYSMLNTLGYKRRDQPISDYSNELELFFNQLQKISRWYFDSAAREFMA